MKLPQSRVGGFGSRQEGSRRRGGEKTNRGVGEYSVSVGGEEGRDAEQIVGESRVRKGIDGNAGSVG